MNFFRISLLCLFIFVFMGRLPAVTVSLPTDLVVNPGEEVTVTAWIDQADGLISFRLSILFDPTRLTFVGDTAVGTVTTGFFPPVPNTPAPGHVVIGSFRIFGTPTGAGSLVSFKMMAPADAPPGPAKLEWDVTSDDYFSRLNDGTDPAFQNVEFVDGAVKVTIGAGCNFGIAPFTKTFQSIGGTESINVMCAPGCDWTATTDAPWITITSGASGNGNGTVGYSVAPLPMDPELIQREATILVGSEPYLVVQQRVVLAVELSSFRVLHAVAGDPVLLEWSTSLESSSVGFHVWRYESGEVRTRASAALIPSAGDSSTGQTYWFEDSTVLGSKARYYYLEEIDLQGESTWHGPVATSDMFVSSGVADWALY